MKKLTLCFVALAAMVIASCGGKANKGGEADSDSVQKPFEQQQIEASIKMHLDSIAAQLSSKQIEGIDQSIKAGTIKLTADEKKVKPDYLFNPDDAANLASAYQKYSALAIMSIDKAVAGMYDMDVKPYDEAMGKLVADLNDPAIKTLQESKASAQENIKKLSTEMEKEGRINFFWTGSCAATVENLYIMSQNADKFVGDFSDEQIANITFRLQLIIDAIDNLSQYDPQIAGVAEAIDNLSDLNATSKAEFLKQLQSSKEKIAAAREGLLK